MNYLKKLLSIFITLVIAVTVTGCGAKSPTKVVGEKLDSIKSGDSKEFSDILNNKISNSEETKDSDDAYSESLNKMVEAIKNITYKVNSENIDGDTAKVNVTLNGPDLAEALSQFMQKAFADAFSQAFSGKELSKEETDAKYDKMLAEILGGMENTDRTMDIELVKENNEWKIKDENDLAKLVVNIDPDAFNNLSDSKGKLSDKKDVKEMSLNEPYTVETEHGNYNLTIEGARATDQRNEFSEKNVTKVVFLDYNYENISFGSNTNQDLYIDANAFQVLDDDGNVLDTYPVFDDNRTPKPAPVGGKCKATAAYAVNTDSENLNVTFKRGNEKVAKIVVAIK